MSPGNLMKLLNYNQKENMVIHRTKKGAGGKNKNVGGGRGNENIRG